MSLSVRPTGTQDSDVWRHFAESLARLVPGLDLPLDPAMTLAALVEGDKIRQGLLAAAIRKLLSDPPDHLVTPDRTLADLHSWSVARRSDDGETALAVRETGSLGGMRTATTRLRPIVDSDIRVMYQSAVDPRWSHKWRYRGATPSIKDFVAQLVSRYNARTDLGWSYIAFTRVTPRRPSDVAEMLEGGLLFIAFLFRNWGFRKLYAEIPGWNWSQFSQAAGQFFTVEGALKEHEFFGGQHWDQYIAALHRERWLQVLPGLAELYDVGG